MDAVTPVEVPLPRACNDAAIPGAQPPAELPQRVPEYMESELVLLCHTASIVSL